jgi:phosphoadenosine phosphosulfate reductase
LPAIDRRLKRRFDLTEETKDVMAILTQADLEPLNLAFEERTPEELLRWAKATFGGRLAALSAMQKAGSVICHMIYEYRLDVPVLFVDTGVMFQETLDTRDRLAHEYGLTIITLQPKETMAEQTRRLGVLYLDPDGQKQCCLLRKIEPLRSARGQFDGLIGSLRRAEGGRRGDVPILAIDPEMNAIRVNPLAKFSDESLERYIAEHRVVINPLHEQGFSTIGCNRCTTPVLPTEPPRAGRWRHLGPWSAYCHINPTDKEGGTSNHVELPQELVDKLLGRSTDFSI